MKRFSILLLALALSISSIATDVQLVVEKVDNHGLVPGNTYRVYAVMPTPNQSLHIVFGDQDHPLAINCTGSLFQHAFGGYSSALINEAVTEISQDLLYDSWITVGYENSTENDLWDLGVDFSTFDLGGNLFCNNGGWFLLPTDDRCLPQNGLVLIGQFTTSGIVSGVMNLQGWTSPQVVWRTYGATFTSENAHVFGCMDSNATNYNSDATYDNGVCEYRAAAGHDIAAPKETMNFSDSQLLWEVFPNPLQGNLIHIQFKQQIQLTDDNATIDIYNLTGALVGSHTINSGNIVGGNKLTISQDLPAGTYKVVLGRNGNGESKTLVVVK